MDWKECIDKKLAKKVSVDEELIKSLMKTSINRLKTQEKIAIDEITASSKFSLAYDSAREMIEALALKKGFKIYNHESYTAFLKEIIKNSELGEKFDDLRKIRNLINYYGKEITADDSKKLIESAKELRKKVEEMLT
jgi:hypothetical protein